MFGHYTRVFGFAKQVLLAARKKPVLFAPLVLNIALAVPVHALLLLVTLLVSDSMATMLMPVGLTALYFIDYFAGGLNTAMVYEEQTAGNATLGSALKRTLKAAPGILVFAVVSGLLDFAVQMLSSRRLAILRPLLLIIRSFWSTATFVVMPSMVIEGLGFAAGFKRSKELAENDPTQLGVGYLGIGLVTSLISFGGFLLSSFVGYRILMPISPVLGLLFSLVVINATWAIAAYLKSTYYTCYYMWTRECERNKGVHPSLAPAPLRNVLADIDFASMGIQLAPVAAGGGAAFAPAGLPAAFAPMGGFAGAQGGAPASGPAPQPQGFAPGAQPQGFAPPQPQGFAQPQPQGFAQPQPQPQGFAPGPQPQGFAPPQPQGFAPPQPQPFPAPQPQGFAPPQPQPFPAPQPQGFAPPQPQPFPGPQPQGFPAPQPQPFPAPQPQPFASPQPQGFAPPQAPPRGPAPAPQSAFAPTMQAFPATQPHPGPQPYPQPAPRPQPAVQPFASAPQPYPQPAPRPQPAVQPFASPQPQPQPQPQPAEQPWAQRDSTDLVGDATMVTASPFDDDEGAR